MVLRMVVVSLCLALGRAGQAAPLRVSAEAPLSAERLADALRSYVDGADLAVDAGTVGETADEERASFIRVSLRRSHGAGEDAEVIVIDGEETVVARLPGALRTEDLYRTAALKVQALLERRAPRGPSTAPAPTVLAGASSTETAADRVLLDVGMAALMPTAGHLREGLRLGVALRLAQRWRLGLGAYLEPPQSTTTQGIAVSSWELPVELGLGLALHRGVWQAWLEAVGQTAVRRVSATAPEVVSATDTAVSPRLGAGLAFALPIAPALFARARVAMLGVVADKRYRVDGQVVAPAARALLLAELEVCYGVR